MNGDRLSSSILRKYVYQFRENKKDFDLSDLVYNVESQSGVARKAALSHAIKHTYEDLPPMEQHKKVPFFIKGKVFELVVTGKETELEKRLVTFDNLRSKKSKEYVADKVKEVGPDALLLSTGNLEKLRKLCASIHTREIPASIGKLLNYKYNTIGDLLLNDDVIYSYLFMKKIKLGNMIFTLTGECDGVLPIVTPDGKSASLILEIKTSSKMYYRNHMNFIIKNMSYDFQVMFYTFALGKLNLNPLDHTLFLMANPSRGIYNFDAFNTLNPKTLETFRRVLNSLISTDNTSNVHEGE